MVTIRLSAGSDPGHFIPNLRPDNFIVYEDGIRQRDVTVDIEHAPVTWAVLLEGGGRYRQLNRLLGSEIPFVIRPLLDVLDRDDRIAVFSYATAVDTLFDFDRPLADLDPVLNRLKTPGFSEANLYDALITVLNRMQGVEGRKALLVITSGIDTFSRTTFDDVVRAAKHSDTPVYCISLRDVIAGLIDTGPLSRIDWTHIAGQLQTLSKVSGGYAYVRDSKIDIPAIYDDIVEHLRITYVIRYVSSNQMGDGVSRTVRVELADRATGSTSRTVDAAGKVVTKVPIAQDSYIP